MLTSSTSRVLLLALAFLVALSGCREPIVADVPADPDEPEPPAATSSGLYIKSAPGDLRLGTDALLRVQLHPEAVRYYWQTEGDGRLSAYPTEHPRTVRGVVERLGTITVSAYALDAADQVVGVGSRTFVVTE